MDNYNFKTNFIGKDGFVWWIGQVAPEDSWIKNFEEYISEPKNFLSRLIT